MTYTEKIIDAATGNETIREYTKEETAEVQKAIAEGLKLQAEIETTANAKAALLTKLGITADEAKLLLS